MDWITDLMRHARDHGVRRFETDTGRRGGLVTACRGVGGRDALYAGGFLADRDQHQCRRAQRPPSAAVSGAAPRPIGRVATPSRRRATAAWRCVRIRRSTRQPCPRLPPSGRFPPTVSFRRSRETLPGTIGRSRPKGARPGRTPRDRMGVGHDHCGEGHGRRVSTGLQTPPRTRRMRAVMDRAHAVAAEPVRRISLHARTFPISGSIGRERGFGRERRCGRIASSKEGGACGFLGPTGSVGRIVVESDDPERETSLAIPRHARLMSTSPPGTMAAGLPLLVDSGRHHKAAACPTPTGPPSRRTCRSVSTA